MRFIPLSLFLVGMSWAQPADPTPYTFPRPRLPIPISTTPESNDDRSTTESPWSFAGVPLSTIDFQHHRLGSQINFSHLPSVEHHTLPTHITNHLPRWIIQRNRSEHTPTTGRPWRWEYTDGRWRRVWNSESSGDDGESSTQRVQSTSPGMTWGYHRSTSDFQNHLQVHNSHSSNYTQGVHDENNSRQTDHKYSLTSDSGPSSPESGEVSDVSTSGSSGASGSSEGSDSGPGSGSE